MSEDTEKRKAEILSGIAQGILDKEDAEAKAKQEFAEAKAKQEADQRNILVEMKQRLSEICEMDCEKFPVFLEKVETALVELCSEYDALTAKKVELVRQFKGLRVKCLDRTAMDDLFARMSLKWKTAEPPKNVALMLNYSFTERLVNRFLSVTILRFLDLRFRGKSGIHDSIQ